MTRNEQIGEGVLLNRSCFAMVIGESMLLAGLP